MTTPLPIGAHVENAEAIAQAQDLNADAIQISLGDPTSWKGPTLDFPGGPAALKEAAEAAGISIYVHSPFIINVASPNNRIRIPSRKLLQRHIDAAAQLGARGVIVHGGHVTADTDPAVGFENWEKCAAQLDQAVPVLIENTAGGARAMARELSALEQLWEAVGPYGLGFCFDTCHAWAGGLALPEAVEQVRAITGRIDLVHANNSRDGFDSRRDRHANFTEGNIPVEDLFAAITAAQAPIICETPNFPDGPRADIALLRAHFPES